ncbi:hypothetical protein OG352_11475 [Streptomyces sp. NBC_01485]|uniref:hypothetical protein n=1 Tax=Streptomyces sp. NBC_01485 TaxID=2903884 RepID=UPI002E2FCD85|nr:hypothetical protein [Streptomyces sp. NBC_01485]
MTTERPENDDAAREPEEPVKTEATNETDETDETGHEEAKAEESGLPEAVAEPGLPAPESAEPAAAAASGADSGTEEPVAASGTDEPPAASVADQPVADSVPDAEEPSVVSVPGTDPDADESGSGSRRRSPVLIASVAAAAVLLVGGGGAYLTSSAVSGSGGGAGSGAPSGDGTPAALLLDDYSGGTGTPEGGTNGIAPGEPNPYGVTYKAVGTLPDGPGSASAYWAKGEVTKDDVARLAKALGAAGTPMIEGDAWKVGSGNDGSGPVLRVNRQAPGTWTFTRYTPGTDNCTGGTVKCTPGTVAPAGDPVSEAVAKKAAAPVLKAVGQDDAKVDASQIMGAQRVVNADPVIGGLPTYGWTTGISVNAQGEVVGGNGQLETPAKGDTYPLLSAQEALDALNSVPGAPETPATPGTDHRMGIGGCASPVPLKDRLESPCGSSTAAPTQETVTVEDAVLGLAPHTSGGRQVLVPSWLFDVKAAGAADGYTVTQPAVEPAYLKSATTPTPAPTPSGSSQTRDVQVDGYTVEGDALVVSFTGGVCADYKATAAESGGEVKVTVTETPWPDKICIMIAKQFHQTVQLDASLGSRKVVGSDGTTIPLEKPGARLPQVQ